MPKLEIRNGTIDGEIISVHERATIETGALRDGRGWVRQGFIASDETGNIIEYLVPSIVDDYTMNQIEDGNIGKFGMEFTDTGVCIGGVAAYLWTKWAREGEVSYRRETTDEDAVPSGPPVGEQAHTWIISFASA